MHYLNKKIAILGFGEEALDILTWLKIHSRNCFITVFDQRTAFELKLSPQKFPGISFSLGSDYLKGGLNRFDIIFRSPGFYRLHPVIKQAEKQGVVITSAVKLFFELCPSTIIGVTGTKGKGTTSSLIYHLLKQADLDSYIGGNIGKPILSLLPRLTKKQFVCLELSSFQLQDLTQSPHIAVMLNITQEHLNIHASKPEYRQAKLNLIRYQTVKDFAILNHDYVFTRNLFRITKATSLYFSKTTAVKGCFVDQKQIYLNLKQPVPVGPVNKLLLRGRHNWENVTAAVTAAALSGVSLESIRSGLFKFKGLQHRLELVGIYQKVSYYNDSFSTTPETAIAAIRSFTEPQILILGGSDKGSDFTALGKTIVKTKNIKALILIGQMSGNLLKAIKQAGSFSGQIITGLTSMADIVNKAKQLSAPGDVVVLSPACASFDMFKNYKDRGNQFIKAVKKYGHKTA